MTSIDNWFHRQMGKSGERAPMNGPVGDPGDQRDSWGRFGRQPENAIHKIETNTSIHRRALRTAAGGDGCRPRSTFLFKSAGTSNRRRVVPLLRARQSRDAVSDVGKMSPFLQTHNGSHPESGNWRRRSGGFRPTGRAWCAARRPASVPSGPDSEPWANQSGIAPAGPVRSRDALRADLGPSLGQREVALERVGLESGAETDAVVPAEADWRSSRRPLPRWRIVAKWPFRMDWPIGCRNGGKNPGPLRPWSYGPRNTHGGG